MRANQGRVTVASVKNFQLVDETDQERIVLQVCDQLQVHAHSPQILSEAIIAPAYEYWLTAIAYQVLALRALPFI
jgi:hypothetical protein